MPKKAKQRPRTTITRLNYLGDRTPEQAWWDSLRDIDGPDDMDHDTLRLIVGSGRELADRRAPFQKGRGARPVAWQAIARKLYKQTPRGPRRATQVWDRLVDIADGDHEVIHEAVTTDERSTCDGVGGDRGCAKGPHLHYWARAGRDGLLTVSRKRVLNFLSLRAT